MIDLSGIVNFLTTRHSDQENGTLSVRLKDLNAMRHYVPYLKDFNYNQSSLQSGNAKSSFKGRGMEFEEVRSYNYGDDVRDIDWRVTARRNEPYTKLYAEEKDREIFVWLDLSAAMRFGTKKELKSVTAAKTAALLGWFTLLNKDRFKIAIYDGNKTHILEALRNQDRLLSIFKKIEQISEQTLHQSNETVSLEKSLQLLQQRLRRRSILFLISSFNDMTENLQRQISHMAHGSELFIINIYDALEADAPPKGEYNVQYNHEKLKFINTGHDFALKYAQHFAQKRQKVRNFCAKFNCQYREIRTDLPIYSQLKPI